MKRIVLLVVLLAGFLALAIAQDSSSTTMTTATTMEVTANVTPMIETRAVWIDKSDIYKGKEAMLAMFGQLSAANFNSVYLPTMYRGYVNYPGSKYLPADPQAQKIDKDYLYWLVKEARNHGFLVGAWPEYGLYAYFTKDAKTDKSRGALLTKYPDLTSIDVEGNTYLHNKDLGDFYSVCPANPKTHDIMIKIYSEMVQKYAFDELNLDRIRFPTKDFCFCTFCQHQFKKDTGYDLTPEIVSNPVEYKAWIEWRKLQVVHFMQKLSQHMQKIRPDLILTAAVWPPTEIDEKGQDWPVWLKEGYLDIGVPMLYEKTISKSVSRSIQVAPSSRQIYPGVSADDKTKSNELLVQQIQEARDLHCGGVVIWNATKVMERLDYLKSTIFKEPAKPYVPNRPVFRSTTSTREFDNLGPAKNPVVEPQPKKSRAKKTSQSKR